MTRLYTCISSKFCFQPDIGLDFRYLLRLTIEMVQPTTIPEVTCDLGKEFLFMPEEQKNIIEQSAKRGE